MTLIYVLNGTVITRALPGEKPRVFEFRVFDRMLSKKFADSLFGSRKDS